MKPYTVLLVATLVLAPPFTLRAQSTLANGTAANISNRARSGAGDDALISGFVVKDAATFVLIRAVGPGLAQFGVADYASGTSLDVFDAKGAAVAKGLALNQLSPADQDIANNMFRTLGAFALSSNSADSFAYICLNPGSYSVVARPTGANPGIILTEVYFDSTGIGAHEPRTFDTPAAAAAYVKTLFAGGSSEMVKVGQEDVLVVQTFGSGVPVVFIATYRFVGDRWKLASEWKPLKAQIYNVREHNGDVVAVGERTGEEWVLLDL